MCPECGRKVGCQTYIGIVQVQGQPPVKDDVNTAFCGCGWKGKVSELLETQEVQNDQN